MGVLRDAIAFMAFLIALPLITVAALAMLKRQERELAVEAEVVRVAATNDPGKKLADLKYVVDGKSYERKVAVAAPDLAAGTRLTLTYVENRPEGAEYGKVAKRDVLLATLVPATLLIAFAISIVTFQ